MDADTLITALSRHQPVTQDETPVSASVMVLFIKNFSGELFLLVTKRPDSIATYAGDYCFPGGIKEKADRNLRHTAERELEEELNLKPADYQFIAQIDDVYDRYGNVVRPFVAIISQEHFDKNYRLAHEEIESIYLLPVDEIKGFERDNRLEDLLERTPLYSYKHDNVFIWGLTARIIVHLRKIIFPS